MADFDFSVLKLPIEPDRWRDAGDCMFHACFTILGQFVEEEWGTDASDYDDKDVYRGYRRRSGGDFDTKAVDLWLWYRDEFPKLEKEYNDDLLECYVTHFREARESKFSLGYLGDVKDEKMAELIAIRGNLWA